MVLGLYYLTKELHSTESMIVKGENKIFYSPEEVIMAYNENKIHLNACIKCRVDTDGNGKLEIVETTVGRILFNQVVPKGFPYINELLTKKSLRDIIGNILKRTGTAKTANFLDDIKDMGFQMAFKGGLSFNLGDVIIPGKISKLIDEANKQLDEVMMNYHGGLITGNERYNQIIDIWTHTNARLSRVLLEKLANNRNGFNPVYMMLDSGARGSQEQIRQLSGMRGLMANTTKAGDVGGVIIEIPFFQFKEACRYGITLSLHTVHVMGLPIRLLKRPMRLLTRRWWMWLTM
jgi:DNA-directed RNA polymerase subunit beta'